MDLTRPAFATLLLIAVATPGPTVLLALPNGSRHGVRVASCGIAGAALSDLVLIGAVSLGLGALLATSQVLFEVLKWLGVANLCYPGNRTLRQSGTPATGLSVDAPAVQLDAAAMRRRYPSTGSSKSASSFSIRAAMPGCRSTSRGHSRSRASFTRASSILRLSRRPPA